MSPVAEADDRGITDGGIEWLKIFDVAIRLARGEHVRVGGKPAGLRRWVRLGRLRRVSSRTAGSAHSKATAHAILTIAV